MKTLLIEARTHGRVLVRETAAAPRGILIGFHGYMENAEIQMERLESIPGSENWTLVSVQALNRFYRGRSQDVVAGWMTREDREAAIEDNIDYVNRVVATTRSADTPIVFCRILARRRNGVSGSRSRQGPWGWSHFGRGRRPTGIAR